MSLFGNLAAGLASIKEGQAARKLGKEEGKYLYGLANLARAQAAIETAQRERMARRREGTAAAAFSSSGIEISGSVLDVLADIGFEEELGVALTKSAGEQKVSALENEASFAIFRGRLGQKSQQRASAVSFANLAFLGIGTGISFAGPSNAGQTSILGAQGGTGGAGLSSSGIAAGTSGGASAVGAVR